MSETASAAESRIQHFPVAFFSVVMGLVGLAIAWQGAQSTFGIRLEVAGALRWLGSLLFVVISAFYLTKLVRFRAAVIAELRHPIQLNFFPTASISMILLATAWLGVYPAAAAVFWAVGTAFHLLLTLYVLGAWMHHEQFEIHHINPAWFLPVVGNVLVPLAGVPLGYLELSWFFFSVGVLFWLVLLAIIVYRMLFHQPLPDRLMPTFFILIAPPAAGFIAYGELSGALAAGEPDVFGRILYYSGLFLTLLLLTQAGRFVRLHYYLSWWAYSFPLAAVTIATLLMFQLTGLLAFAVIGWTLLSLVTLVVVFLLYRTAVEVSRGGICVPHL
jgi:tellurite resistance protein